MMPGSNMGLGFNIGFPDVCLTPAAPSPVPIPYPNLGANAMSLPFCVNIFLSFLPALNMGEKPAMTNGDNAGVNHAMFMQPGGNNMGSVKVLYSGLPAEHLLNPTQGNNYNCSLDAKLVPSILNTLITYFPETTGGWTPAALATAARELHELPVHGLGVTARPDPRGGLRVLHVRRGSAAERLGVAPADRVPGLPEAGEGEPVELEVDRRGRRLVLVGRVAEAAPAVEAALLPGRIGLVTLRRVSLGAPAAVRAELEALAAGGARALVLDLRRNPGGSWEATGELAGLFLGAGATVGLADELDAEARVETRALVTAGEAAWTAPLVALVDRQTASAAEVLAAALQDRGRARLVGSPTVGKGFGLGVRPRPDGLEPHGVGAALRREAGDALGVVRPDLTAGRPLARPGADLGDPALRAAWRLAAEQAR